MSGYSGGTSRQLDIDGVLREHRTRLKNLEAANVGTDLMWEDVGTDEPGVILGWYFATTPTMIHDIDGATNPDWGAIDYSAHGGDYSGVGVSTSDRSYCNVTSGTWLLMWSEPGDDLGLQLVIPMFGAFLGYWTGTFWRIQIPEVSDPGSHPFDFQALTICFTDGTGALWTFDQVGGRATGSYRCNFLALKLRKDSS